MALGTIQTKTKTCRRKAGKRDAADGEKRGGQVDPVLTKALAILELPRQCQRAGQASPKWPIMSACPRRRRTGCSRRCMPATRRRIIETQRYGLGPTIMRYGLMGVRRLSLHRMGRPLLERLHRRTGETAVLAIRQGDVKLFLDRVEKPGRSGAGPISASSCRSIHGGAGHADPRRFMPEAEREEYLSHGPFPKVTPATITDPDKLRKELELVRQRRYAITAHRPHDLDRLART